jgi:hypothetical protein
LTTGGSIDRNRPRTLRHGSQQEKPLSPFFRRMFAVTFFPAGRLVIAGNSYYYSWRLIAMDFSIATLKSLKMHPQKM